VPDDLRDLSLVIMNRLSFSYVLLRLAVGIALLVSSSEFVQAGSKEAYRNYFIGSYHYNEGAYLRAEDHLRRAYRMEPGQFTFALAYALVLGRLEKTAAAEKVLTASRQLLSHQHPDYEHLLSLQAFVQGMIQIYGGHYTYALQPLQRAVDLQEGLDFPTERSIMLNALGYLQIMNQGRSHTEEADAHFHVHPRDMQRALDYFEAAYRADVQHRAARNNYLLLCDSLNQTPSNIIEDERPATDQRELRTAGYPNLPANVQPLLEFLDYEEVVLLLDISGSMVMEEVSCIGSDRFKVMRETALLLLEHFAPNTQVGIGTIGGDCGTEPRLWHPTGSLSRKDLRYALQFLVPDGTTPLLTILQETPTLFADSSSTNKAIIFISDGENICRLPGVDICEWSEQLRPQGITLNVMTFLGNSLDNSNAFAEYTCLAENTFGQVLYLDGNRCRLEHYKFDLVKACSLEVPPLERVNCGGPSVERLWAIFPE
jgi:hypothetical protein